MKRLLISLILLPLLGAGCFGGNGTPESDELTHSTYRSGDYEFAFDYPEEMEVRVREDSVRENTYLDIDVDFFISLRDMVRDVKATNIAYFYAAEDLTIEAFKEVLEATSEEVSVIEEETFSQEGIDFTRMVSTTELGIDKTHYLFERGDRLIVVSVFLEEEEAFQPVLDTFRK